ncbi:MFS transporter [Agromyces lapidis]|uniref:MFS transporter n=1 Tax=Agromyces lapidis TaxID=279574 RepID=A0ABV5SM61_9MICO|nr:MFS transporter [Agromyces lapidis]
MYISFSNTPATGDGTRGGSGARVSATVVVLGVVSLLTDVSSESTAAVLPLYVTSVLGLGMIAFGFLDGLYQGVSALVRITGGWAADRSDQPKWIAFIGYGCSALARIALVFATGFGALLAVITADRIGKGIRTGPRDALISAASDPSDLGRSFGVHRMLDTVGAAAGPLIAFLILFLIPDGFSTVFVVSLAFAVMGVVLLGLAVPNLRPRADRAARTQAPRTPFRWRSLLAPELRRLLVVTGVLGLLTIGDGFLYLLLQARDGFAAEFFPLLYVGTNVVFLALAVPIGRLADRFGRTRVFVLGYVALLAAYLAAAAPSFGLASTLLCLVLLGVFYASTDGILAAIAAMVTPPEARATGIAAAQTVVALARLIASTGFGVLWYLLGPTTAVLVMACGLAVAIPVIAVLLRRKAGTTS